LLPGNQGAVKPRHDPAHGPVLVRTLLGWQHAGFSLHHAVRIGAADTDGRRAVAEYILCFPFSHKKS